MIELTIPGRGTIQLQHLVSDVNGTLALDGHLIPGVSATLLALGDQLQLHLLTADTHGRQSAIDEQLGLQAVRIPKGDESQAKAEYVKKLGGEMVVAIGQGNNDAGMLREATIGIAVLSDEGLAYGALQHADVLSPDILSALDLLMHPIRLVATLRQ
ncbi:MAG: ATPase P [Anaerolineales bacterium]|nr:MAG: ATPase P [Anaerolineales bacterium]